MPGAAEPLVTRILLVRHGHYERVGELGDTVWGLSTLGRRQAARTGRRLQQIVDIHESSFEGLYSSPWPRALQTAEIASHELGVDRVTVKPYLHESIPLVDAPLAEDSVINHGLPVTSPEDHANTVRQVTRVRERFFHSPRQRSTYVLFSHGNLIRYLVAGTLNLPFEAWGRLDCTHCGITEIRVFSDGYEALVRYNDAGHLPPSLLTNS
ncbi:MAG: histidine phosphatase family protein [Nannocystis sp.]|jgi:broad specificity phosphatase PhoE|nr:histidine phosphatase family protein [Nannocystis sp.]